MSNALVRSAAMLLLPWIWICSSGSCSARAIIKEDKSKTKDLIRQFLEGQNQARAKVGVPPLKWDNTLQSYASGYAAQRKKDCELRHSGSSFGENIFWGKGTSWTPSQAVAAWVDEEKLYHHDSNRCSGPDCSHYTQLVWRTSTYVGCAIIRCESGDTFATCNYSPPGNYINSRPY